MGEREDIGRTIAQHQATMAAYQRRAAMHRYEARLAALAGDLERADRELVLAGEQEEAAALERRRAIAASRSSAPGS